MRVIIIFSIAILAYPYTLFSQRPNTDSILNTLAGVDSISSKHLKELKRKGNSENVYAISERILLLIKNNEVKEISDTVRILDTVRIHDTIYLQQTVSRQADFFERKDSLVFIDYASFDSVPAVHKGKDLLIKTVNKLWHMTKDQKLDTIVLSITKMKALFDTTNNGVGLEAKRQLSDEQKAFVKPLLIKVRNLYDDYFEVASAFNPILINSEQKEKLLLKYRKPVQQAYLRTIKTAD